MIMRRNAEAIVVGITGLMLLGYVGAAVGQTADARAAIEAGNKQFAAAVAKGDAAQLAAMYTGGAMVFPPNGDIVRGREAIQKLWQGALDSGVKEVALTTVEVEAHGDTAHEVGTYDMKGAGGQALDRGKYIVIWKRDQGQWRLHRDIWNTSMPPPAPR
jgi:uncharacterized protein (TIGR02246 family)